MTDAPPDSHDGMSLPELLVVLALVAVLVGLLLPALVWAIGAARCLECQNNLRHIYLAYRQYLADSGGVWPPILTTEAPTALLAQIERDAGLRTAPPRPAPNWGQPGPHWSIVLWPYLRAVELYICPSDPKRGLRGEDVCGTGRIHSVALLDAPPESYALNVILFRTSDDFRRRAGCNWGTAGDSEYSGLSMVTALADQRRQFPAIGRLIHFFCGASGQTLGSQFNVPFRTGGLAERWEWHPQPASAPFVDEPGRGSNYLFGDGRIEYRDALPPPVEWGYETGAGGRGLPPGWNASPPPMPSTQPLPPAEKDQPPQPEKPACQ